MATLENIMQELEGGSEKVASEHTAPAPSNAAAQAALQNVLHETSQMKTAAAASGDPIEDLKKLAQDLSDADKEAEIVQAKIAGRAFGDALLEQWAAGNATMKLAMAQELEAQSSSISEADAATVIKQAADQGYADVVQELAPSTADPQAMLKKAAEQGYSDASQQVVLESAQQAGYTDTHEKIAEEQYATGQNDAIKEAHDKAANEFMRGAQEVNILVDRAQAAR
ncbi:MAG: hypothetical protein DRJ03_07655 [Chloroflexi bacterium]|nr:MAG: hypothetical protein DRJ03_07655 [Chloroflexota bacterium]